MMSEPVCVPSANSWLNYGGIFDLARMTAELNDIEVKTSQPDFWKDTQAAAKVNRRKAALDRELSRWRETERRQNDIEALLELALESGDAGLEQELLAELEPFEKAVAQFRIELLLSGELDSSNAIFAIHPGAGGTESQDWAQMLLRMYVRWAEQKGFKVETLDLLAGDEAGIKSATLSVSIALCGSPRSTPTNDGIRPSRRCLSTPNSMTMCKW